jgi:hypothetical protein
MTARYDPPVAVSMSAIPRSYPLVGVVTVTSDDSRPS